ncbi:hypothetical protein [Ewingella americana]|uniref:Uncharacterized protein n=1 Tax=Ewingella americana TaxID=41202 RepID=A0A502GDZ8_9GAMM|nr:hypothetical protein [Ewingella americana]TPG60094.1 hypothetical protein EAH77_16125 [Ewingella americana]
MKPSINERLVASLARVKASKASGTEHGLIKSQIAQRVCAALVLTADDAMVLAAVEAVDLTALAAAYPEQGRQIQAGVAEVIAAFEELDDEDEDDEDSALTAFTSGLNSVLACLLVGEHHREESIVAAAIHACASTIQTAFYASDELADQLADAVPAVLNALDLPLEDDSEDGDDDLNAACASVTAYINAHAGNPKRLTALASSLNALGNLTLASLSDQAK